MKLNPLNNVNTLAQLEKPAPRTDGAESGAFDKLFTAETTTQQQTPPVEAVDRRSQQEQSADAHTNREQAGAGAQHAEQVDRSADAGVPNEQAPAQEDVPVDGTQSDAPPVAAAEQASPATPMTETGKASNAALHVTGQPHHPASSDVSSRVVAAQQAAHQQAAAASATSLNMNSEVNGQPQPDAALKAQTNQPGIANTTQVAKPDAVAASQTPVTPAAAPDAKPVSENASAVNKPPVAPMVTAGAGENAAQTQSDNASQQQGSSQSDTGGEQAKGRIAQAARQVLAGEQSKAAASFDTAAARVETQTQQTNAAGNAPAQPVVDPGVSFSSTPVPAAMTPTTIEGGVLSTTTTPAGMTEADSARLVDQASRALSSVVQQKGGAVTLRLSPAELGALRIRVEMGQTTVRAQFFAETDAVRSLLQSNMGQLRTALEAHGLTVEHIQVQTSSASQHGATSGQDAQDGDEGRSRGSFGHGGSPGREDNTRDQDTGHDNASAFERQLVDLVA